MDARKAARRKLGTKGWIRLDGGFLMRPCTVVDMSTLGVGISIDTSRIVSDPFELVLSRETRQVRRCIVVWRNGPRIGAKFSQS
ncbi:MAG: PilZ domain-containing protein [Alphaproteobacteria bacterium]|nr:PilZ domain-containing protein [Alphaproteobacteria bacterium]